MRNVINPQLLLNGVDIGAIHLDPKSRDDIPQLLRGLQHIYTEPALRERVFAILQEVIPQRVNGEGKASSDTGRPGMEQWRILVLGVLRLGLNADYDRIHELANQHSTLRQMLGHADWGDKTQYKLQTLKDNLRLFTPELLERINQAVVDAGHVLVKKKDPQEGLAVRCDSFVVKTHVHFPTDINLLWDASRKTIEICADLCQIYGLTEWRQSAYNLRQLKKRYRRAQKLKHSTSKDQSKRQDKAAAMQDAHRAYLDQAQHYLDRARDTRRRLAYLVPAPAFLDELDTFMRHAERQIDQIERRVLQGQTIPHEEKVFSLFQPHTEWIVKGKAGVPVELGLRVCVVEDQHRFILNHQVMQGMTDDEVAVPIIEETRQRFGKLHSVSMDKGFHSQDNQADLKALANVVVLPKKGRLSALDRARESDAEFVRLRQQHSAVESAINALEQHGLDVCPDHGIVGFERYVALAVVARNVQRLGAILRQQDAQRIRGPYKKAA
ncbi:MAG: ISNCY family transposase [Burkholderiaceae bacterium]